MNAAFHIVPWLIILAPFLILICAYGMVPDDVLISKSFFGDETVVAPKSLFTVFRVPLIEVVCAAVIEVMRRLPAKEKSTFPDDYFLFWTILLYTVGLKSVFQALELVMPTSFAITFWYLTLSVVIVGVLTAIIVGRKLIFKLRRHQGTLGWRPTLALLALLLAYLGLAIVPVYYFS